MSDWNRDGGINYYEIIYSLRRALNVSISSTEYDYLINQLTQITCETNPFAQYNSNTGRIT